MKVAAKEKRPKDEDEEEERLSARRGRPSDRSSRNRQSERNRGNMGLNNNSYVSDDEFLSEQFDEERPN